MPLNETSGNVTTDAFGGGVPVVPTYIEDVFSCFLYDGSGASRSITNNIDLSTKGGLVWIKNRFNTGGTYTASHILYDTARGMTSGSSPRLITETTDAQVAQSNTVIAGTTGFDLGSSATGAMINGTNNSYASWTFRKQPKFFDVVTWSGNSFAGARAIPHNLGVAPAVIIVKNLTNAVNWFYIQGSFYGYLNTTAASNTNNLIGGYADQPSATSTSFDVYPYSGTSQVNETGSNYVAYLFASNAGGFGLTGTDNVITCGSFTNNGSGAASVTLGYEPQWVMIKNSQAAEDWLIADNMRGMPVGSADKYLVPNTSAAEASYDYIDPTATGFNIKGLNSSQTYIYIAIRRGPMKVPTVGTSVYNAIARTGTGANVSVTGVGFTPDFVRTFDRSGQNAPVVDRLRGNTYRLYTSTTGAEAGPSSTIVTSFDMDGVSFGTFGQVNASATNYINHFFKRAPSFFDEVCYTGTGSATTFSHNLQAVPELMIVKCRSNVIDGWMIYSATLPASSKMILNRDYAELAGETTTWNSTRPTASVFSVGTESNVNNSGYTYVSYLFATCAGVSKVGSYTGNGTTQTINCGFTGGARFVLIKRTDSTGDWYVYDTARGMTVLTDPYLLFNDTAAETATLGSVTTVTTGFALNSSILAAINVSSGTYIFFAVA